MLHQPTINGFIILITILFSCQPNSNKKQSSESKSDTAPQTEQLTPKLVQPQHSYGIDISKFQGDEVSLFDYSQDSLSFIICKATEGITYTDPDFSKNWNLIQEKKYIRGAYHFYISNDNSNKQANNFLSAIADLEQEDLPPIVDFEEGSLKNNSLTVQEVQENLLSFLTEIESRSGRKPIIYTDVNTGNQYLNRPDFSNYLLWIANYSEGNEPKLPQAWKDSKWFIWQKSDSYTIRNISNDFDIYNGSKNELISQIASYR